MTYNIFNIVDTNSRQFPFDISTGVKIKTETDEYEITHDTLHEALIMNLIKNKTVFHVVGSKGHFTVNPENIVGILYTVN